MTYSVTANGVSARSGTLTIGGQTFTVNQFGTGPTVSIDRPSLRYGATNSGGSVTAQTSAQIAPADADERCCGVVDRDLESAVARRSARHPEAAPATCR